MDVFYDGEEAPKKTAEEWVHKNDKEAVGHPDGTFSKQDRRLLWGSRDLDLHEARHYYYDEHPVKYDRLSTTKKNVDRDFVFTANKFSVGPHPARLDIPIKGADTQDLRASVAVEP
ncbi:hypothetical protein BGZ68_002943 [Mortierella alpina]|nr:hypothetical protein BGZ68_002943 [Mortierella alpina]